MVCVWRRSEHRATFSVMYSHASVTCHTCTYALYAGTVMTSFDYIANTNTWKLVPNKPSRAWIGWSHWYTVSSDDHTDNTVSSVCVTNGKDTFRGKFDQDVSLYCGSVKSKFQAGLGDRLMWESCELWFPKFTDNFDTVSSKIYLKAVTIFIPLKQHGEKLYVQFVWNQCQWKRDVCIHYDVSLYQRM